MKFLVAQIGARRGYAVPAILERAGMLESLYTDLCADAGLGKWLARTANLPFVNGRAARLAARRLPENLRGKTTSFAWPALAHSFLSATTGRDPDALYRDLTREFGDPVSDRIEAPATPAQKKVLASLSPQQVGSKQLAGEAISEILTRARGNGAAIGGVKVITESGWFAARPSGTEDIYKIYAESFKGQDHLRQIVVEAQAMVDAALAAGSAAKRHPA